MGHIGLPELLVVLLIVLLFFGAKKLPEISRSLGQAIREFKQAGKETPADPEKQKEDSPKPPSPSS